MLPALSLTSLLTTGCLIPEPPEYGPPERTPIFIVDSTVTPNPRNLLTLSTVDDVGSHSFGFKTHSEDEGEDVVAALFANYKHDQHNLLFQINYDPSTFDVERTGSLYMSVPDGRLQAPGCYAITLMVLHETGWDEQKKLPIGTPSDIASVTWFVALTNGDVEPSLSSCPTIGTEVSRTDSAGQ
jgi:hypothetical protein